MIYWMAYRLNLIHGILNGDIRLIIIGINYIQCTHNTMNLNANTKYVVVWGGDNNHRQSKREIIFCWHSTICRMNGALFPQIKSRQTCMHQQVQIDRPDSQRLNGRSTTLFSIGCSLSLPLSLSHSAVYRSLH